MNDGRCIIPRLKNRDNRDNEPASRRRLKRPSDGRHSQDSIGSKMAFQHLSTASLLSVFLPRISQPTVSFASRTTTLFARQLSHPLLPTLALAIPSSIHLNIPGLLSDLWDSVLRAVPKKKTSHMKKRHRQMAGKGLKDVTELNKCSGCGAVKRAHVLCPYCVAGEFDTSNKSSCSLIISDRDPEHVQEDHGAKNGTSCEECSQGRSISLSRTSAPS